MLLVKASRRAIGLLLKALPSFDSRAFLHDVDQQVFLVSKHTSFIEFTSISYLLSPFCAYLLGGGRLGAALRRNSFAREACLG